MPCMFLKYQLNTDLDRHTNVYTHIFIYIYLFIYLVFFILYCRVGLFSYAKLLSKDIDTDKHAYTIHAHSYTCTYIDLWGTPLFSLILLCTPQGRFIFFVQHKIDGRKPSIMLSCCLYPTIF